MLQLLMAGRPGQGPGFVDLIPLILITFVIFYLIVLRPEAKKQQGLASLERGDRVLMKLGIYGTVLAVDGDVVHLRLADQVKIEISVSAIDRLIVKAREKERSAEK
jgi:preprotein translocase subunit YajC